MQGRIGDSPMIGCGGYANEYGGCSTTGHGESLMKMTLAREAVFNIEKGNNAQVTTNVTPLQKISSQLLVIILSSADKVKRRLIL